MTPNRSSTVLAGMAIRVLHSPMRALSRHRTPSRLRWHTTPHNSTSLPERYGFSYVSNSRLARCCSFLYPTMNTSVLPLIIPLSCDYLKAFHRATLHRRYGRWTSCSLFRIALCNIYHLSLYSVYPQTSQTSQPPWGKSTAARSFAQQNRIETYCTPAPKTIYIRELFNYLSYHQALALPVILRHYILTQFLYSLGLSSDALHMLWISMSVSARVLESVQMG